MAEKEYIEREEAYSLAKKVCEAVDSKPRVLLPRIILDLIDDLPAADVRPVVRGKWIIPTRVPDSMLDECSVCGFDTGAYTYNFCPNCGADMRGANDV